MLTKNTATRRFAAMHSMLITKYIYLKIIKTYAAIWFCALQVPAGNNPVRDCSSVETFDRTAPRMT
jgi:hypothetical protein